VGLVGGLAVVGLLAVIGLGGVDRIGRCWIAIVGLAISLGWPFGFALLVAIVGLAVRGRWVGLDWSLGLLGLAIRECDMPDSGSETCGTQVTVRYQ
jgi:hypothetical protein